MGKLWCLALKYYVTARVWIIYSAENWGLCHTFLSLYFLQHLFHHLNGTLAVIKRSVRLFFCFLHVEMMVYIFHTLCNWSSAPVTYFLVVRDPHSVTPRAALKTTCWKPPDPSPRAGLASGDSESLSMFCQKAYPRADGTRLALEHCSPLRQKEMVGVPLEMCLMPVKVSAGTLAQSFLRASSQWKPHRT